LILCVAPGPAVDRTAVVPRVVIDQILRPQETLALPGGKGVNVARAAKIQGADVMTTGVAGGHAGRWLVERLDLEGLEPHFVHSDVEARTTYVVTGKDGRSVMVYEPGEPQPQSAFDQLLRLIREDLLPRVRYVAVAGSVPPGVDPEWLGRLVAAAKEARTPILVDARGASLRAALAAGPDVLKANEDEIADLGLAPAKRDPAAHARAAVQAGAGSCVVTLGSRGAVGCTPAGCWRLTVPVQRAVNTVGAGDAFTAGMIVAAAGGAAFDVALARAGSAAAASVIELGAGRLDPARAEKLLPLVRVRRLTR
jgi:tagatose 6-phosphate kinase